MTTKAIAGIIAAILGIVVACAAGGALILGGGAASTCTMPFPSGAPSVSAPPGGWGPVGRFDAEQVGFAATIVFVGAQMGVPIRGWIIAVATALQESDLRNPPGGDQDSIGLFQQRPSQGWGTPEQIRDPVYASGKFYEKLLTVAGWQSIPLTEAAQAVQRSAYPDAYAKHEPDATLLVNTVGSANWRAIPENLEQCLSNCPEILSKTPAGLRNHAGDASQPDLSSDTAAPGLLKISGQDAARIARNGQGSALRIVHQFAEPTNAIGGGVFWDSSAGPSAGPDTGFACGGDGGDGQPNGDGLALPADYTLPPSTPPAAATAIFWALSQLGTSYVFGGSCTDPHGPDPSTHCDCSSLVQQAYRAGGITIPRTTTDQIYAGTAVADVSQIQPGDLLFIPGANGTPQHPGHVGMAIGDGLLIQAPHTGDVVKITKLSQWANQISIIRRVA